jgi:hypothetical protein
MTIDLESNLFSASLFFRSSCNGEFSPGCIWEESIIILKAKTVEDAYERSVKLGMSRQTSYLNSNGEKIEWTFVKVERVFNIIDSMIDGGEVFSRFLRSSEALSIMTTFSDAMD